MGARKFDAHIPMSIPPSYTKGSRVVFGGGWVGGGVLEVPSPSLRLRYRQAKNHTLANSKRESNHVAFPPKTLDREGQV